METVCLYSMGKRLQLTAIFDNDEQANAHMEKSDDAVVATFGKFVLLANKYDNGWSKPVSKLLEALAIGVAIAEDAQEYAQEVLSWHLLAFGETTQKNKAKADRVRQDIVAAKDAQMLFRGIIGVPNDHT